ncbi:HlyD family secretion protein [Dethiosulfatarculus sandiegensis]|uniref:RND transporter n=1 Tax=Dethiosulfatarculus sandiegensis TaxID=1429043 RepID=A0A0D2JT69_9BACT|nr:efflux RND transporter periplasmic adaptor subunit [Dethiosulfatarculus sandiegensis]KIX12690.1 RND transporter [Dethiosulfatarculus sandiegensis]
MRKYILAALAVILLAAAGFFFSQNGDQSAKAAYRTAKLEQRDLVKSISATGTLNAVVTVDVGSQISGQVSELMVDYNSPVKKDQIIARIDPLDYEAKLRQAQAELDLYKAKVSSQEAEVKGAVANLENAESNLLAARAAVAKNQASLQNAKLELARSEALIKKDFIAKTEYDQDLTTFQETKAQLEQAKAQERAAKSQVRARQAALEAQKAKIKEAQAQVRLKQAALESRKVDLEHTIIRSPVDGVVINREVDVGQTVAASLQAPVLFTIAQDLREMEVAASVDETDIGNIRQGQDAIFTVDAFGDRKFTGSVKQIRKAATTVQNVVTYTVIIAAENRDLSLLPGMTAEVKIILKKRPRVLAAPNAALRFQPPKGAAIINAQGSANEPNGKDRMQNRQNQHIARLSQALELSSEQIQQLKTALSGLKKKMAGQGGTGFGPGAGSRKRAALRQKLESAILQILTPAQKDQYMQLARQKATNQSRPGKIYSLEPDGSLKAWQVMIGVTDDAFSQVRANGLRAGLTVVTGRQ